MAPSGVRTGAVECLYLVTGPAARPGNSKGRFEVKPDAYEKAKERVEEKMGFFSHLGAYVIVNAILLVINLTQSPQDLWFYWPLLGWGIGLFFHGMGVFVWGEGSSLKDRMIDEEMRRLKSHEDRS
jgi:hypothetical protein